MDITKRPPYVNYNATKDYSKYKYHDSEAKTVKREDDDEEIKKIETPNKSKKSSGSKLDSKVPLYQ